MPLGYRFCSLILQRYFNNSYSLKVMDIEYAPQEKDHTVHSKYRAGGLGQDDLNFLNTFPEDRKNKILRKVDVRFPSLKLYRIANEILAKIIADASTPVSHGLSRQDEY